MDFMRILEHTRPTASTGRNQLMYNIFNDYNDNVES